MQHTLPTVAVVDDDFRVLEALENLLISVGFESLLYSSAEEFLEADVTKSIGCLISDVEMPGMKGLELLSTVRSTTADLPIILISAHHNGRAHNERDAAPYIEKGANHYFSKPFDGEGLMTAVRTLVRNYSPR